MTTKQRFEEELKEHLEDGQNAIELGKPAELSKSFNVYFAPKRNRKLVLLLIIYTLIIVTAYFGNQFFVLDRFPFSPYSPLGAFFFLFSAAIMLTGTLIEIPIAMLIKLIFGDGILFNWLGEYFFIPSLPIVGALFWMFIITVLLLPPPNLRQKTYAKTP